MEVSQCSNRRGKSQLPPGLEDLCDFPLYIQIACWGLRQNRLLTTALVSRVFFITQSQARDALHYMQHEGKRYVSSKSVPVIRHIQPLCKGIRVLSVDLSQGPVTGKQSRANVTLPKTIITRPFRQSEEEANLRRLRQWMITRRAGDRMPADLQSDNSGQDDSEL